MCDTREYVARSSERCNACWRRNSEQPETILDDPWQQDDQQPISETQEARPEQEMTGDRKHQCVESSKGLAIQLARRAECGFVQGRTRDSDMTYSIYEKVIHRLAFIANINEVPRDVCESAAQCGGLKQYPGRLQVKTGTDTVADADNATYAAVVRKLVHVTKVKVQQDATPHHVREQIKTLKLETDESLAFVCKAALAAAWVAHANENNTKALWTTMAGGVWAKGDMPTRQEVCS